MLRPSGANVDCPVSASSLSRREKFVKCSGNSGYAASIIRETPTPKLLITGLYEDSTYQSELSKGYLFLVHLSKLVAKIENRLRFR